jgi:hypothetical protein
MTLHPMCGQAVRLFDYFSLVNFISVEKSSWEGNRYRTQFYPSRIGSNGEAEIDGGSSQNLQYESTVNFNKSFNNHNLQAVGGYTFQESDYTRVITWGIHNSIPIFMGPTILEVVLHCRKGPLIWVPTGSRAS